MAADPIPAEGRAKLLTLIYRHTPRDYKGRLNGERTVLVLRKGGTTLVPLSALTDEEIHRMLPYATKKEAQRLAKKNPTTNAKEADDAR